MFKVKLLQVVIACNEDEFVVERDIEMPFVCVGLDVLGVREMMGEREPAGLQELSRRGPRSCSTIQHIEWDCSEPDHLAVWLDENNNTIDDDADDNHTACAIALQAWTRDQATMLRNGYKHWKLRDEEREDGVQDVPV